MTTLLEHSANAEIKRSHLTLWVKVKDRHGPVRITSGQMRELGEWLHANNINCELVKNSKISYLPPGSINTIQFADKFYSAIFCSNLEQWVATKITWGDVLSEREF